MELVYLRGEQFDKIEGDWLKPGEYEDCTFANCDLSNVKLDEYIFDRCIFDGCNLSLTRLQKTTLREVIFKNCKMWGLRLDECNHFSLAFSFENCSLNHSSFYQLKLKKTTFKDCQLIEADFTQCDLTGAAFHNCDLSGANFDNTILEQADLRTAYNYSIDPERNKIKKAKFSLPAVTGLLNKYDITIEA